ncbi:MAG: class II aldolase/adducin family protein [Alphaproteobacteria bacterium]
MEDVTGLIRELVIANRILAREGVVDAFGHISVRNPINPESYFISVSRAPELITVDDIVEFRLDGEPIGDLKGRTPYGERAIHGGIYEVRTDVNSVVHNHSQEVVPFAATNTLIRPLLHMSAPMGAHVPIWDIRDNFGETNHLVVTMEQGRDLAATLGENASALMKRHGCVCARRNIREVVMTAVYLQATAKMIMQAKLLGGEIDYLTPAEVDLCNVNQLGPLGLDRAWEYWVMRSGFKD